MNNLDRLSTDDLLRLMVRNRIESQEHLAQLHQQTEPGADEKQFAELVAEGEKLKAQEVPHGS